MSLGLATNAELHYGSLLEKIPIGFDPENDVKPYYFIWSYHIYHNYHFVSKIQSYRYIYKHKNLSLHFEIEIIFRITDDIITNDNGLLIIVINNIKF